MYKRQDENSGPSSQKNVPAHTLSVLIQLQGTLRPTRDWPLGPLEFSVTQSWNPCPDLSHWPPCVDNRQVPLPPLPVSRPITMFVLWNLGKLPKNGAGKEIHQRAACFKGGAYRSGRDFVAWGSVD